MAGGYRSGSDASSISLKNSDTSVNRAGVFRYRSTTAGKPLLNVSDLPTDPKALAQVIAAGGLQTNIDLIPAGPNATFERAATLLVGPTAGMTPALASALFQVLAGQPGVQLLGSVTDHEGHKPGTEDRVVRC